MISYIAIKKVVTINAVEAPARCQQLSLARTDFIEVSLNMSYAAPGGAVRDLDLRTFDEYVEVIGGNAPHALVLDWWRRVELALDDYLHSHGKKRPLSNSEIEKRVANDAVLGPEVAGVLTQLRHTRNTVAHELVMLLAEDAAVYTEAAFWMIGVLSHPRPPYKIPAVPTSGAT